MHKRPLIAGIIATALLLLLFALLVGSISGWPALRAQWQDYWPYLISLALGFGIQVGLYVYLRAILRPAISKRMMAVTGSTSTVAMVSCCTHYLANIFPIIGVAGLGIFVGQYQIQIFWVGLAGNLLGITLIARKVMITRRHMAAARTLSWHHLTP